MQQAVGEARVQNKGNRTEIEARFAALMRHQVCLEYLTYVLWAVSPQGAPLTSAKSC